MRRKSTRTNKSLALRGRRRMRLYHDCFSSWDAGYMCNCVPYEVRMAVFHRRYRAATEYKKDNTLFERIKANLTISKVLETAGVKYERGIALCPLHPDTSPSFSFDDKKGVWRCWSSACERQGDVIDLVAELRRQGKL